MRYVFSASLIINAVLVGLLIGWATTDWVPDTASQEIVQAPMAEVLVETTPAPDDTQPVVEHVVKAKTTLADVALAMGLQGTLVCMVIQDGPANEPDPQGGPSLYDVERDWGIGGHLSCTAQGAP